MPAVLIELLGLKQLAIDGEFSNLVDVHAMLHPVSGITSEASGFPRSARSENRGMLKANSFVATREPQTSIVADIHGRADWITAE
jgi:hypothetical protein